MRHPNTISFGSLFLEDLPVKLLTSFDIQSLPEPPAYVPDQHITLRDDCPASLCPIQWLDCGDFYICDRNLLRNVSWLDLNNSGLISGKEFTVNGQRCFMRIPTNEEWDTAMSQFQCNDNLLHWISMQSWTADTTWTGAERAACIRGGALASDKFYSSPDMRYSFVGFRPILMFPVTKSMR